MTDHAERACASCKHDWSDHHVVSPASKNYIAGFCTGNSHDDLADCDCRLLRNTGRFTQSSAEPAERDGTDLSEYGQMRARAERAEAELKTARENQSAERWASLCNRVDSLQRQLQERDARIAELEADNRRMVRREQVMNSVEYHAERRQYVCDQVDAATASLKAQLEEALRDARIVRALHKEAYEARDAFAVQISEAKGYLSRLLVSSFPIIEPLNDLMGICTQIDNGFAVGFREAKAECERLKTQLAVSQRAVQDASSEYAALAHSKDLIEAQWGVMARACGNYRAFTDDPTKPFTEWETKEFQAAAGAILQLSDSQAECGRMREALAELVKYSVTINTAHRWMQREFCVPEDNCTCNENSDRLDAACLAAKAALKGEPVIVTRWPSDKLGAYDLQDCQTVTPEAEPKPAHLERELSKLDEGVDR